MQCLIQNMGKTPAENQYEKFLLIHTVDPDDPSHILYKEYELMASGRRYRVSNCKLNKSNSH